MIRLLDESSRRINTESTTENFFSLSLIQQACKVIFSLSTFAVVDVTQHLQLGCGCQLNTIDQSQSTQFVNFFWKVIHIIISLLL